MSEKYLAHTENEKGEVHYLDDHLKCVGELAEQYTRQANPALGEMAKWAGLLHDLGKYRDEFQEYLVGQRERSIETHHAVYGSALAFQKAQTTKNQAWIPIAFAVAAHHAGLHDKSSLPELFQKYEAMNRLSPLIQNFENELEKIPEIISGAEFFGKMNPLKLEFATRMIFSSLVDADFLDTEKHYRSGLAREPKELDSRELLKKLNVERTRKVENAKKNKADEKLIEIRNRIFDNCLQKAEGPKGFFSLTVPTGGGKTLSAMAFALKHAEIHKLRRVVVVIPYLSIIEQNAKEYREILGEDYVIENHSAVKIKSEEEEETAKSEKRQRNMLEYAAENWDAPIIVTTSVQFIESLFAHKTSKCRKLHNIANSVVILDEVQTLPAKLLEPLFDVWRQLKENYGVSFVFSTATQPAFRRNNFNFINGLAENELEEITENTDEIFRELNRVKYEFKTFQEPKTWADIADQMKNERQVLCVLNTRKHAFELWDDLSGKLAEIEKDGLFHLSSAMCAEHRLEVIEEIKKRLQNDEICRVVSTQLVEAGVDLDFPVLFRAIAPLDSIVQAAGRCNREGKLKKGRVVVFTPSENVLPPGIYKTSTEISSSLLHGFDEETLGTNHEIFADYFRRVYQSNDTGQEIQADRESLSYREVSKKAKVIENEGIGVIIQYKNGVNIIQEICSRGMNLNKKVGFADFNRRDLRSLQRFMVNLYPRDFEYLNNHGQLDPLIAGKNLELFVVNEGSYHKKLGVLTNNKPTNEFYVL